MSKTVAIVQSFYIPWKGYFDWINTADELILYDDMQYARRFWNNRNKIKTAQGIIWLTIPVQVKGKFHQTIKETKISDPRWNSRHWETLQRSYARAAHFKRYRDIFEPLYLDCDETLLSRINCRFISAICQVLGIRTRISWSMDFPLTEGKTARLVDLCRQAGADIYVTGPTAKAYLQEELFRQAGIGVKYMDYSVYPIYPQLYPPFIHEVSILDMIFNVGPEAPKYMLSINR
ncbi:MAG TPA: WbqC family protein [bacterium]|jgi:hypothetical protein